MRNQKLRNIIFAGLLVAIGIVLSSILSISYPPNSTIIRFGIGYLPLILISIILGPKMGLYSAIVQDILGYFVYIWVFGAPSGPFYLGFTLNSILYGVLPGLIYHLNFKDKKLFKFINYGLLGSMIALGIWGFFNIANIILTIENRLSGEMNFSPAFVYSMLIVGWIGLVGTLIFIILHRKEDDSIHRILFSVILLQIIVGLILTPLWVSNLYGIPFWPQLPVRIIKTPIEIFIYSVLLIRIVKVLQLYIFKEQS